ncbi:MAG: peptide ABC transporter substrate-binding protein [Candidatus Komeilibacteria bacterium]
MTKLWSVVRTWLQRLFRREQPVSDPQTKLDQEAVAALHHRRFPSWEQLRYINKILTPLEKRRALLAISCLIIGIIGWLVTSYYQHTYVIPARGGSYTEGLIGTPRYINPLLASANDVDRDLAQLIFSGLLKTDSEGQLVPDLAQGYTVSQDKKVYTFQLREKILWHDGEPLTANDVLFTLSLLQDPEFKSPLRLSFNGVRADIIDERTIRFTLDQPYPAFLANLTIGIIPKHIWYAIPPSNASLAEAMTKPIGSGPYKFKSLVKDNKAGTIRLYTLEANDNYYLNKPYISELSFKFYPDFNAGVDALQNQNIEGLSLLPKENSLQDKVKNRVHIINLLVPQYTAAFFNPENNPLLKDVTVRKALALALDRPMMVQKILNGQANVINSPILPGTFGYDSGVKSFDYDPGQAGSLLDTAGWKKVENNPYRQNQDKTLELSLTTVDQPESTAMATSLKDQWEAIGVKTTVNIVSRTRIRPDVIEPRSYQILLFGQILRDNQDPYMFWHSSQTKNPGLNLSNIGNKDVDSSLEKARATDNATTKTEAYKLFQNTVHDQVLALFLYNPSYSYALAKKIKGVEQLTRINVPADRFTDITHWYIKTHRTWSQPK